MEACVGKNPLELWERVRGVAVVVPSARLQKEAFSMDKIRWKIKVFRPGSVDLVCPLQ